MVKLFSANNLTALLSNNYKTKKIRKSLKINDVTML